MIASVPEEKTMAVYNSISKLVGTDVPPYLMSQVKEADAKAAYAALMDSKAAVKGVLAALKMGEKMDPKVLHGAVEAHHKAIAGVDAKGIPSEADFAAINAGLGQLIASVPQSSTMDVYNSFAKIVSPDVSKYMMGFVASADARAAYDALLTFKDTVKAVQR